MAERIVSPGVFTRERDLSFLPAGIAAIGACIIGPTVKGPAFVPTQVSNFSEFEEMFGSTDQRYYTPYAVEQYLSSAGSVTIVRVLNTGGYTADSVELFVSGAGAATKQTLAVLLPSRGGSNGTADLEGSTLTVGADWLASSITLSGSNWGTKSLTVQSAYAFSFDTGSADYIGNVFSIDPQVQKSGANTVGAYLYKNFKYAQSSNGYGATAEVTASHGTFTSPTSYSNASTPYIQSQLINSSRYNLFKINTRSHGSDVNNKYKVLILNVKKAGSVAGSDYGQFSLQLRQTGLNDNGLTTDNILEQWDALNFDPLSTNFFARRIGDRYVTIDANGKLTHNGDWNNRSKHIYLSDFSDISNGSVPKTLSPMGHAAINNPFGSDDSSIPAWTFKVSQSNAQGEFDSNVAIGVDYGNKDTEEYLAPYPTSAGDGANTTMSLED